ncbi:MAG: hypothetical protein KatS3mg082_3141 [Nitrospiraceae bacterium]|nr:MAG: hypothetical protein KatS3mg082_3141 [Nitrospiraceae bacterium]
MNLTDEQKALLKSVVAVYESGDKSQFIVNRTMTSSSLVYAGGHPPIEITADDADFEQLEREGLLTLTRNSQGSLCGKPTKAGIEAVRSGFAWPAATAPNEIVGDGDPATIQAVVSFLGRNNLPFEAKPIEHATQLIVRDGPAVVMVNVFNTGKIVVQGTPGRLRDLLTKMKEEMAGGVAPGTVLPFEIARFPERIREKIPDCDAVTVRFIEEAIVCYKSDALLATAFMLGAASERAINLMIECYADAIADQGNREKFRSRINGRTISARYEEFKKSYAGCKSKPTDGVLAQDLDAVIGGTFQFCRITRNEVGHPQIVPDLDKGVILANLGHFVTYIERIYALMRHFQSGGVVV